MGGISTARETRLVTATSGLPPMLWVLILGGAVLVRVLIFFVTMPARPGTQAALVAMSAGFTAVLVLLVFALNRPFAQGPGRVSPKLIEDTTATMVASAPELGTEPCRFGPGD